MTYEYIGNKPNDPTIKRFEQMTKEDINEMITAIVTAQANWVKNISRDSKPMIQLNALETVMVAKGHLMDILGPEIHDFLGEEKIINLAQILISFGMFLLSDDDHVKFPVD